MQFTTVYVIYVGNYYISGISFWAVNALSFRKYRGFQDFSSYELSKLWEQRCRAICSKTIHRLYVYILSYVDNLYYRLFLNYFFIMIQQFLIRSSFSIDENSLKALFCHREFFCILLVMLRCMIQLIFPLLELTTSYSPIQDGPFLICIKFYL